jgi:hypothetical protein
MTKTFSKKDTFRTRLTLFASMILLVLSSGYGVSETGEGHPIVISESFYDIDHDGEKETIQIVMEKGRHYLDKESWCGKGEKWEGRFTIRTIKGLHVITRQSLNELLLPNSPEEEIFFWKPRFGLVLRDYNGDGRIDFNLGQYGSCNGNFYQLFSINPNGTTERLPVADSGGLFVSDAKRRNSTEAIRSVNGGIECTYYDNRLGKNVRRRYTWNGQAFERATGQGL